MSASTEPSSLVTVTVAELPVPPADLLDAARHVENSRAEHDRLVADLAAFNAVEYVAPAPRDLGAGPLRVAAWNAERLKHVEASAKLLRSVGADIVLLTEADRGMARSGNRHTVVDLAGALGMGYAYGVEFLELGLGDEREREWHRGEVNRVGFHGNAILSRLPLAAPIVIRLDDGAVWWLEPRDDQRRIGFRMAVAAEIETRAGPLVAVAVHLESKSDADDRAAQFGRLLVALDRRYGNLPMVIGGDLNTKSLPSDASLWTEAPERFEPLFAGAKAAGFDWRASNDRAPTMRMLSDGQPEPPYHRLDWLFTRGLDADEPHTIEAIGGDGQAISDHEMITAEVARPR